MNKLGPHVIIPTPQAMEWARRANCVKSLDSSGPLRAARPEAIKVLRCYFANQGQTTPQDAVEALLDKLGGWRAPNLYVEGLNEYRQRLPEFRDFLDWTRAFVMVAHGAGLKVAAFSFSTGNPELDEWALVKQANYCGADAIALHEYFNGTLPQPLTGWNALRYRRVHNYLGNGHPPFIVTECGADQVEGGAAGWKAQQVRPEVYTGELLDYAGEIAKDDYVLGATVFTSGPTPDWANFSTDELDVDRLTAPIARPALLGQPRFLPGSGFEAAYLAHKDTLGNAKEGYDVEQYLTGPDGQVSISWFPFANGCLVWSKAGNTTIIMWASGEVEKVS